MPYSIWDAPSDRDYAESIAPSERDDEDPDNVAPADPSNIGDTDGDIIERMKRNSPYPNRNHWPD